MSLSKNLSTILDAWPEARSQPFAGHDIANCIRNDLPNSIEGTFSESEIVNLKFFGSPGQGNWATVPWSAIFDRRYTETAQNGIYPVFLFKADGSGVYLSLGFGATTLIRIYGLNEAKVVAQGWKETIRKALPGLSHWNSDVYVNEPGRNGANYNWATAGAKYYSQADLKNNDRIESDLKELTSIYKRLVDSILSGDIILPGSEDGESTLPTSHSVALPKPFLLLAGISGTGKTRFVREQAKASRQGTNNYEIVPVRPDWHEPSDLLGYISRLGERPEYVPTKVLTFIAQAWANLNPTIELDESGRAWWIPQTKEVVNPYWLCLDEMNLAPVEQYFADYLSVLETREFDHSSETLRYRSDALVSSELIKGLGDKAEGSLKEALGVSDQLFEQFKEHGIPLPFNLIIAGTVNMDETTHGFSRKVIDRAFTIDFGLFFENRFDEFFEGQPNIQSLTYSTVSDARAPGLFDDNEAFRDQSVSFLDEVNSVLKRTPFELAFRALNELLLSVYCFNPKTEKELTAVWDDFLMTKVLPRIEGDSDKLSLSGNGTDDVLSGLELILKQHPNFRQIVDTERTDFFRKDRNGQAKRIRCRSISTLERMQHRLRTNGYTSFWP